ncbi:MAG: GGDEF domain-containing protein [Candidatus Geothermincolia bacterium]
MGAFSQKRTVKKMVQAYRKGLDEENESALWDDHTEKVVETLYGGMQNCVEDELYLQEFLPFGSIYRVAGEHGVYRRNRKVPIEKVMQEHILLRDVFWEARRGRSEREHDFATEKRVCQCFNNLLQATVQAYQTREPTMDVLDPLRDDLTGVFNSLYFMTRLEEEVKRSERYLRDVTVVLIHVDSVFEPESEEDNELMRAAARVLRRNSRASDILARVDYGKFSVLMPETRKTDATLASERLKIQVLEYLTTMGDHYADVNIEIGIASYPEHGDEGAVLMQEATESIIREGLEGH